MEIIIKDALPLDIDCMLPLLAQQYATQQGFKFNAESWARGLRLMLDGCGKHRAVKVAWVNDAIVGMCTAQAQVSMAQGDINAIVNDLIVDRAYRKKGVATLLLSAIESWAANKGIKSMFLLAEKDDRDGLYFYSENHWERTSLICLFKALN